MHQNKHVPQYAIQIYAREPHLCIANKSITFMHYKTSKPYLCIANNSVPHSCIAKESESHLHNVDNSIPLLCNRNNLPLLRIAY